jgi:hypothetical protein
MTMLHMTIADLAHEYAPYHNMPGFNEGAADYVVGRALLAAPGDGLWGQAYDRGAECAMRVQRCNDWVEAHVGLD